MPASLKFESAAGTAAKTLAEVKIITLEDTGGSIYTLDITTSDLKVAYRPQGGQKVEETITGLATALGSLLTIDGSTAGKSVLAEKVANKDVVKAIFSAKENANDPQSILVTEVAKEPVVKEILGVKNAAGTKTVLEEEVAKEPVVKAILKVTKDDGSGNQVKVVETELGTTFAKKDGTNIDKDFAGKVLDAKDGNDLVLTKKVAEKAVVKAIFSAKENANDPQSILVTEVAKEPVVKEILGVKNAAGTKTVLEEEVAKKPVVDALIPELAKDDGATGIYTKKGVDDELAKKAGAADLANKANTADVYTKTAADTAFVKATELKTKAAAKDVVDAIFDAKDGNNKISETKIGATFAKKNASNLTDAANQKAFAEAILPAKDGNKSILVDKLEGFLAENAKVYSNNTKTAKELLVPSDAEIAAKVVNHPNFTVNVTDEKIKEVVKETVSQPSFDIPPSDDAALNWTW